MKNPFLAYAESALDTAPGSLIPQHAIDAIREVLPPSVIISKRVRLRNAGRELKGLSPFNRERTPSFFVNDEKRSWYDFSSNQNDIFAFVMKMDGVSFREAVQYCADMAGIPITPCGNAAPPMSGEDMTAAAADREERRRVDLAEQADLERRRANLARAIARDSRAFKLGDGSPPALFLESRGLFMPEHTSPRALLYHPACPFRDDEDREVFHPALIGIYREITGDRVMAISRRPLMRDGRNLGKPISLGPTRGCAIKLTPDEDVAHGLHLAEGITSALAAAMLGMSPIWATGGTGGMAAFPVLAGIVCLTLICDNDMNGSGQRAADECLTRWKNAGKEAWIVMPETPGTDMADHVAARRGAR
jgi:hypothetical protein